MISVIIPHANSLECLRALLHSIDRQKTDIPFEVIAVINPAHKYAEVPPLHFSFPFQWQRSKAGANAARQEGVRHARGEVLLFLDDDCELNDPLFFQRHYEAHVRYPHLIGIGGPYKLAGHVTVYGRIYHDLQNQWLSSHRLPSEMNLHLLGGNSSYKRVVFETQSFDERIVFGGTETEFQIRLYHAGFSLKLLPDLALEHKGDLALKDFVKKSFKQGIGAQYIYSTHEKPPRFVFADSVISAVPWQHALLKWVYRTSFDAGKKYFLEVRSFSAPNAVIYRKFIAMVLRKFFAKEFFLWREYRNMSHVIAARVLLAGRGSKTEH